MFRDRACPECGRTLGTRYDPVTKEPGRERQVAAVFICQPCNKEWPSCPRCTGIIVEKLRPGDLFTASRGTRQACRDCQYEPPKKVAG